MALTICKECEGFVSEAANACPHCAAPFTKEAMSVVGIVLSLAFVAYALISGTMCSFWILHVFTTARLPDPLDLVVFGVWLTSICAALILIHLVRKRRVRDPRAFGIVSDAEVKTYRERLRG